MKDVTRLLSEADAGDPAAAEALLPLVYDELRRLAAARLSSEPAGQTLDATAIVHETYLRLLGPRGREVRWDGRGHFFAAAAEAMRRILVEAARRKRSLKRGGGAGRAEGGPVEIAAPQLGADAVDLLALDEALSALERHDPRSAELVKLRYFAGLTVPQAAASLGVSPRTADGLWAYAKAWLLREIGGTD